MPVMSKMNNFSPSVITAAGEVDLALTTHNMVTVIC